MSTRLPILIRQSKTFDLVVAGHGYEEIARKLKVSEDTVARDMVAIGEQVQAVARERLGEVIAVALATYQAVIDHAWKEYRLDQRREKAWYAGDMDYATEDVATKTLAVELEPLDGESERRPNVKNTAAAAAARLFDQESEPLEVRRRARTTRPQLRGETRSTWLKLIVDTTREMTELLGVKKLIVEHQGDGGGPLFKVYLGIDPDAV